MMEKVTLRGGVLVSNNKASGLSAITGNLVHKQLSPHLQEYKLSIPSGIQVHPLTKTLTWFIFNSPHSNSPSSTSCKELEEIKPDPFLKPPLCLSLNWAQPTRESHFLKAPNRFWNGSGLESDKDAKIESLGEGIEEDADGKSRNPAKKRMKSPKLNMVVAAKVLRDFNGIVYRGNSQRDCGSSKVIMAREGM